MARRYTVAIAGATGVVGTEMLRTLAARNFPVGKLRLLASARSAGKRLRFAGEDIPVEELTADSFAGVEIALFSAGAARSKEFAPAAVKAGAVVVDNSSAFRMDPDVPLVVPEVNPEKVREHKGIVANPNCSTSILAVPLWPLHRAARIVRIVAATYQAASGAGAGAMAELRRQVREIEEGREANVSVLPQQIAFNLFPHVDVFLPNGYTKEEMKLVHETRKIFGDETIRVTATCVRVPILRAHSEAVNIETERKLSAEEARRILAKAPGVCVVDEPERKPLPDALDGERAGRGPRRSHPGGYLPAQRPRPVHRRRPAPQGAALNAVQIAELLIKNG